MDSERPKSCAMCGYDVRVEIAHIKSVSSFGANSTMGEINHVSNLVALCRNHHWEFDHGMTGLESFAAPVAVVTH